MNENNETDNTWTCSCGGLNSSWRKTCGQCESVTILDTSNTTHTLNWGKGDGPFTIQQPVYVGRYEIGGNTGMSISFSLGDKLSFINRWFCKWCLGWKWIDGE